MQGAAVGLGEFIDETLDGAVGADCLSGHDEFDLDDLHVHSDALLVVAVGSKSRGYDA